MGNQKAESLSESVQQKNERSKQHSNAGTADYFNVTLVGQKTQGKNTEVMLFPNNQLKLPKETAVLSTLCQDTLNYTFNLFFVFVVAINCVLQSCCEAFFEVTTRL